MLLLLPELCARTHVPRQPCVSPFIRHPSFPGQRPCRPATDDRREGYDAASAIDGQLSGTCEPPERRSFVAET